MFLKKLDSLAIHTNHKQPFIREILSNSMYILVIILVIEDPVVNRTDYVLAIMGYMFCQKRLIFKKNQIYVMSSGVQGSKGKGSRLGKQ